MIARKGVLLSDPSVREMNWSQWVFEYKALQKKEENVVDSVMESFKILQRILVSVLGLDLLPKDEKLSLDQQPFMPMSLMVGRPQIMKDLLDGLEKEGEAKKGLEDEAFENFSDQLHKQLTTGESDLPADMVPMLTEKLGDIDFNAYWHSMEAQAAMEALGIKTRAADRPVAEVTAKPRMSQARRVVFGEEDVEAGEVDPETQERLFQEQLKKKHG